MAGDIGMADIAVPLTICLISWLLLKLTFLNLKMYNIYKINILKNFLSSKLSVDVVFYTKSCECGILITVGQIFTKFNINVGASMPLVEPLVFFFVVFSLD